MWWGVRRGSPVAQHWAVPWRKRRPMVEGEVFEQEHQMSVGALAMELRCSCFGSTCMPATSQKHQTQHKKVTRSGPSCSLDQSWDNNHCPAQERPIHIPQKPQGIVRAGKTPAAEPGINQDADPSAPILQNTNWDLLQLCLTSVWSAPAEMCPHIWGEHWCRGVAPAKIPPWDFKNLFWNLWCLESLSVQGQLPEMLPGSWLYVSLEQLPVPPALWVHPQAWAELAQENWSTDNELWQESGIRAQGISLLLWVGFMAELALCWVWGWAQTRLIPLQGESSAWGIPEMLKGCTSQSSGTVAFSSQSQWAVVLALALVYLWWWGWNWYPGVSCFQDYFLWWQVWILSFPRTAGSQELAPGENEAGQFCARWILKVKPPSEEFKDKLVRGTV